MDKDRQGIDPGMTLMEVVKLHPRTEDIFRFYDKAAGECLLCNRLFESIRDVAARHGLDLDLLLKQLKQAASQSTG